MTLNNSPNATTGLSPNELLYGFKVHEGPTLLNGNTTREPNDGLVEWRNCKAAVLRWGEQAVESFVIGSGSDENSSLTALVVVNRLVELWAITDASSEGIGGFYIHRCF